MAEVKEKVIKLYFDEEWDGKEAESSIVKIKLPNRKVVNIDEDGCIDYSECKKYIGCTVQIYSMLDGGKKIISTHELLSVDIDKKLTKEYKREIYSINVSAKKIVRKKAGK